MIETMAERWSPRRSRRDRHSEIEKTVLDVTEQLLGEVALPALEVKEIIARAGISRTTFYQYFSSKFDVIAALVDRTMAEKFLAVDDWVRDDGRPPTVRLRDALRNVGMVWYRHRNLFNSAAEGWPTDVELARLWCGLLEEWAAIYTTVVERDVELGRSHIKGDVRQVLAALVWGTERIFYVATSGSSPSLTDVESAIETAFHIWSCSIYGPDSTTSAPRTH